tara:strand:- start:388 stop:1596 length:1209 start_codon:yes stop_codon:yes gene_type:complete
MKIGPIDAVIAAAGSGDRLGAGTPKAFVEVGGVPLLRYVLSTVESFGVGRTVVAVPAKGIERWTERVFEIAKRPLQVVAGGSTRQASVQACLEALQGITDVEQDGGDRIVMVHDGARPCASYDLWWRVAQAANTYGAAIPVLPSVDSLKQLNDSGDEVKSIDRARIVRSQTPQGFRYSVLIAAHAAAAASGTEATDDATLVELSGHPVRAVQGEIGNIKVTAPGDLDLAAQQLLGEKSAVVPMRVGYGYDIHPLVEGRRLVLGGVEIEYERGLDGHSDADSLVHAIIDALLGAAGLGDIGQKFPSEDQQWKDFDSLALLKIVVDDLAIAGYQPGNIDATILAEEPRLVSHLELIRHRLAEQLDLPVGAVNVKATRGEGMGSIGRGEGIAAHAVATVLAVARG